jgi:uncharacterized protein with PIN domain
LWILVLCDFSRVSLVVERQLLMARSPAASRCKFAGSAIVKWPDPGHQQLSLHKLRLAVSPGAGYLPRMTPPRFVTDASLEFVARRLRFLGYDVVTHRGARLEELFAAAAAEGRIVLTLSGRHPRRWEAVAAMRLPRGDAAAAVRAVAEAHAPAGAPFSRCPHCNVALRSRSAFEAVGEVPGRVTRAGGPLTWCPSCGRWYWIGTHVGKLVSWLEFATGRPLERPPGRSEGTP